ncbi:membrane protein [Microbacterium phage Zooman]|nr:hypothetical protein SEA_ZOOMAN_17 [Microbacterium phage Zooman]UDL16571.1 membrane protein [Microbacterium phage Zooman]
MIGASVCVLLVVIAYLVGRGYRVTAMKKAQLIALNDPDHSPDALIDTRTGEVIDPGTRRHVRATKHGKVRFE